MLVMHGDCNVNVGSKDFYSQEDAMKRGLL